MSRILILLSWFFGQVLGFENTPDYITPGRVENPPPLPCLSDVNIEMSAKQKENVQQENVQQKDLQQEEAQKEDAQKENILKEDVQKENVQLKDVQKEDVQKDSVRQGQKWHKQYKQECNTVQVPKTSIISEQKCQDVPKQKCQTEYG